MRYIHSTLKYLINGIWQPKFSSWDSLCIAVGIIVLAAGAQYVLGTVVVMFVWWSIWFIGAQIGDLLVEWINADRKKTLRQKDNDFV